MLRSSCRVDTVGQRTQVDVRAADQHTDPLAVGGPEGVRGERGMGGGAARLGGDAHLPPQRGLRGGDRGVGPSPRSCPVADRLAASAYSGSTGTAALTSTFSRARSPRVTRVQPRASFDLICTGPVYSTLKYWGWGGYNPVPHPTRDPAAQLLPRITIDDNRAQRALRRLPRPAPQTP